MQTYFQYSQYFHYTFFTPTTPVLAVLSLNLLLLSTLLTLSVLSFYLVSAVIRQVKLRLLTAKCHARRFSHHLKVHCLVWLDTDH